MMQAGIILRKKRWTVCIALLAINNLGGGFKTSLLQNFEEHLFLQNTSGGSSNINEVIRAVLNSIYFFYKKILQALKALKGIKTPRQKHKNANKQISDYFPLRCF